MFLRWLCVGVGLAALLSATGCKHHKRCCPPPATSAYPCCPTPAPGVPGPPPPVATQAYSPVIAPAPGCCNGR